MDVFTTLAIGVKSVFRYYKMSVQKMKKFLLGSLDSYYLPNVCRNDVELPLFNNQIGYDMNCSNWGKNAFDLCVSDVSFTPKIKKLNYPQRYMWTEAFKQTKSFLLHPKSVFHTHRFKNNVNSAVEHQSSSANLLGCRLSVMLVVRSSDKRLRIEGERRKWIQSEIKDGTERNGTEWEHSTEEDVRQAHARLSSVYVHLCADLIRAHRSEKDGQKLFVYTLCVKGLA